MDDGTDRLQQRVDTITDQATRDYLADELNKFLELREMIKQGEADIAAGRTQSLEALGSPRS